MVYHVIGLMSGSSVDGLDLAFVQFHENGGKWSYEILNADCYPFPEEWQSRLKNASALNALDYQILHVDYGHFLGEQINRFIDIYQLEFRVQLIASHGHTVFHVPEKRMTAQIGDGASIAAETGVAVVSDLRSMDIALGGQGAPIVPIGEKLLLGEYDFFLNLGGIANIACHFRNKPDTGPVAFDISPANRVLNLLASEFNKDYDEDGKAASQGNIDQNLLRQLNVQEYYFKLFPKSLANEFGTDIIYPIIKRAGISTTDALRTYVEHICVQIKNSIKILDEQYGSVEAQRKLLVTGGGAFNKFLMERLSANLKEINTEVILPDENLIKFKEALVMALIGVLRWREEINVFASVTGASKDSIGGAVWMSGK
ncbi:MAG: anhydro-N-acetylmuramic acid kinase [Bacteroidetes bacterium]|nr:MAG: anhydro-N-acetylmuramic acid kinase [Bacteroidota bacterium]